MNYDLLEKFQNVNQEDISSKAGNIQDNNNTLQGEFDSWAGNTVDGWAMSYAKETLKTGQTTIDNDAHQKVDEACEKIKKVCGDITSYKNEAERLKDIKNHLDTTDYNKLSEEGKSNYEKDEANLREGLEGLQRMLDGITGQFR